MQFLYRVSFYLLFSLAVLSPAAQACLKGQAAVASPDQ
jgi:gamma-glutamyltranspeptidase/glutathione hydrolase